MNWNSRHIRIFIIVLLVLIYIGAEAQDKVIDIYVDSVVSDVSRHPIGINLDYFMDGGRYQHPKRSVEDALRALGVKYLRYPGGEKSDLNLFSVPPYDKSRPKLARTGKGAVDDYTEILKGDTAFRYDVLDFDEYMTLCQRLNAVPVVVVPADMYLNKYPPGCTFTGRKALLKNAVEWVRYANIKKKYGVKYWMIGNESWNANNGNSTAEIYAQDVLDFAKAMKEVDPSISIIANGNSEDFFGSVIKKAGDYIDYLCLSDYPVWDYYDGYNSYRDTLHNLTEPVDRAVNAIKKYGTSGQKKRLKIIVSEYGPFDWGGKWPEVNDMGHTIANFEMTGDQLLRPEIQFSCFWNTRWIDNDSIPNQVWDALNKEGEFNAIGYSLMIWGNYLGDKMIKTTSAGHMRSFASIIPSKKRLFVYLLNIDNKAERIQLKIPNQRIGSLLHAYVLSGKDADDLFPVWREIKLSSNLDRIRLNGTSIAVIEYQLE